MPSADESRSSCDLLSYLSSCDQLFEFDSDDESTLLGEILDTNADTMTETSKVWLTEILQDGKSQTSQNGGENLRIGIDENQEIYMVVGHCGIKLE